MAEGQPLGDCVRAALGTCLDQPPGEPVATACLISAKDEFGNLLGGRLQSLRDTAEPRTAQIAEIETRYELERALRECDRHLELMLLDLPDDERAAYARAQCETMAVASTLVTLILRSAAP